MTQSHDREMKGIQTTNHKRLLIGFPVEGSPEMSLSLTHVSLSLSLYK